MSDYRNVLEDVVKIAQNKGADAVDAVCIENHGFSYAVRLGEMEYVENAESYDVGLRVLCGKKQAVVSGNDFGIEALSKMAEEAVAMAKVMPEDEAIGLADPDQVYKDVSERDLQNLDLYDAEGLSVQKLEEIALQAEEAALAVEGVVNSDGGEAGSSFSSVSRVASNGFSGYYQRSSFGYHVGVVAKDDHGMETDYDFSSAVFGADLKDAKEIGRSAGERAVRKLGARPCPTGRFPVVYDRRVASSIMKHVLSAINGRSIVNKTSFLQDCLEKEIMSPSLTIVEDPLRVRGQASRLFDAEGLKTRRRDFVKKGVLQSFVLDLFTARKLGMTSTANASRSVSSLPSPSISQVYLENGEISVADLISDIKEGFYVTDMLGSGVNLMTGDYSRGAAGFWIKDGVITHAVNEATIAGNLKDMLFAITLANDLEFRYGIDSPTLRIDGMTVAGA